jgi:hypothetical protein
MNFDFQEWVLVSVVAINLVALIGFFFTKQSGFSNSSTSTLLLLLVVGSSGILLASGSLSGDMRQVFANIFFAVIGFAGGLFAGRDTGSRKQTGAEPPASGSEGSAGDDGSGYGG